MQSRKRKERKIRGGKEKKNKVSEDKVESFKTFLSTSHYCSLLQVGYVSEFSLHLLFDNHESNSIQNKVLN